MLQLNQSKQPTAAQIPVEPISTKRPILHVSKPRGPSAQATSFLRRRKVVEVLASRAQGDYQKPIPTQKLNTYQDYPISDPMEISLADIEGDFFPQMNSHQRRLASPEHDECLASEYWAIQGSVNGNLMEMLPWSNQSTVHSMDL